MNLSKNMNRGMNGIMKNGMTVRNFFAKSKSIGRQRQSVIGGRNLF